jgi:hypothetical protein
MCSCCCNAALAPNWRVKWKSDACSLLPQSLALTNYVYVSPTHPVAAVPEIELSGLCVLLLFMLHLPEQAGIRRLNHIKLFIILPMLHCNYLVCCLKLQL